MKYSIIIPVFNGLPYLEFAVGSVLVSDRTDFELIISDDCSDDGSWEWISSLKDSRVKIVRTQRRMSMSNHWNFAISQASGVWQMFLGQDDAVQSYFFDYVDWLTEEADSRGIKAIVGKRAYLNWPGVTPEPRFALEFVGKHSIRERATAVDSALAASSVRAYHFLPQMYTSSIFHADAVGAIRSSQAGELIVCQPQDASLAASYCTQFERYLYSTLPFSWVGTSPSSAGLAVVEGNRRLSQNNVDQLSSRRAKYLSSVGLNNRPYPQWAGSFSIGDNAIYFWQALVSIRKTRGLGTSLLLNPVIVLIVFLGGFARMSPFSLEFRNRQSSLARLIRKSKVKKVVLYLSSTVVSVVGLSAIRIVRLFQRVRNHFLSTRPDEAWATLFRPFNAQELSLETLHKSNETINKSVKQFFPSLSDEKLTEKTI